MYFYCPLSGVPALPSILMADRLYLSLWLENHSALGMHRKFAAALSRFPFSTQFPQAYLRITAVDPTEPALLEQVFVVPAQLPELFEAMEKWRATDSCFEVEAFWDLYQQRPEGWRLTPTRVNLFFFGPDYPNDFGESIRAELGLESLFLPIESQSVANLHYYQSNIRSLLRLNADFSLVLRLKDRRLWSESGDSFLERLKWISESVSKLEN